MGVYDFRGIPGSAMSGPDEPARDSCSFLCSTELIDRIDSLARENDVNREEAVRQLVYIGLGEVDSRGPENR